MQNLDLLHMCNLLENLWGVQITPHLDPPGLICYSK